MTFDPRCLEGEDPEELAQLHNSMVSLPLVYTGLLVYSAAHHHHRFPTTQHSTAYSDAFIQ